MHTFVLKGYTNPELEKSCSHHPAGRSTDGKHGTVRGGRFVWNREGRLLTENCASRREHHLSASFAGGRHWHNGRCKTRCSSQTIFVRHGNVQCQASGFVDLGISFRHRAAIATGAKAKSHGGEKLQKTTTSSIRLLLTTASKMHVPHQYHGCSF